jgi:hypothetical protein
MLERIWSHLLVELRAIGRAPVTFVAAVLVSAALLASGVFFGLRREADLLRQQIAEYREKLGGVSAEEARTALDTLADEVSALQARLRPRRVSMTERQALQDHLKLAPGARYALTIVYEGGCWDCPQYAADFDAAFRAVPGWQVSNRVVMGLGQRPPGGLALVLADPSHPSAQEAIVQAALQAARIDFDTQQPYPAAEGGPQLLLAARPSQ